MNFDELKDELKLYLPKFLSSEAENELYSSLRDFAESKNIVYNRFYTRKLQRDPNIFQGDGIRDMLIVNLPDTQIKPAPSVIFSNTCDIALDNIRLFPSQIVYAPIFNLEKYKQSLIAESSKSKAEIDNHIKAIQNQRITQIFYLPANSNQLDESIVFLDRTQNCSNNSVDRNDIKGRRIFTLSDYGAYIFVLKLSIHFTRIQDQVERGSVAINHLSD